MSRWWTIAALVVCGVGCKEVAKKGEPTAASAPSEAPAASSASASADPDEGYRGIAPIALPAGYYSPGLRPKRISTRPDPKWSAGASVKLDDSFVFELGMGDGRDGLNVTTIAAGGRARHAYSVERDRSISYREIEFTISREELAELVSLLNRENFLEQPRSIDGGGYDGASWIVFVRSEGRDKYVSAANAFPEGLMRIARHVSRKIVDPRADLAKQSGQLPSGHEHDAHLWNGYADYTESERGVPPHLNVRVSCEGPCPAHGRITTRLVDRTSKKTLKSEQQDFKDSATWFWSPYEPKDLDGTHDYVLELDLKALRVTLTAPGTPVITKGHPYVIDIRLKPPE